MARIHTFTDFDGFTQDASNSFGPINNNQYRVTSIFTSTNNLNAYAVTKGLVFLQKTSNPLLCNLVLKPIEQFDVDCRPVKYFIYRGLKLDSFSNTISDLYLRTENGISDLLIKMYADWSEQDVNIALSKSTLRLDLDDSNFADDKLIDEIFQEDADNQLPIIEAGDKLGKLNTSFGFEIILEEFGYYPTMEIARTNENIIEGLTIGNEIQKRKRRDEILAYIDPAAYYGLFYNKKIVYHTTLDNEGSKIHNEDIFNNVLNRFYNQNKIYIDIRNEHNHSLNFYDNYGLNPGDPAKVKVKYIKPETSIKETKDYESNLWPLLILDISSPNQDTSHISLQFKHKDNYHPVLYSPTKSLLTNENKNELYFIPLFRDDVDWDFTKEGLFNLEIPSFEIGGQNVPITYYFQLKYNRQYDTVNIETLVNNNEPIPCYRDVIPQKDFFDNLLSPFSIRALWKSDVNPITPNKVYWTIANDDCFDGWKSGEGVYRTFQQGVANDNTGETAFVLFKRVVIFKQRNGKYKNNEIKAKYIDDIGIKGYATGDMSKSFFEIYYNIQRNILKAKSLSDEDGNAYPQKNVRFTDVKFTNYSFYEGTSSVTVKIPIILPPHEQLSEIKTGDIISFSYSYADKIAINNIINGNFDETLPIYFFFSHKNDIDIMDDEEDERIYVKELWLRGFKTSGTIYEISTSIKFYSINNYYYFSESYSAGF